MINTLTTLYSSLKSYYNNLIVYGHSYENRKLVILKGVLDVIKELRCYSYTSNQDITDIYSIVEYIVNSSDIFKKEYAPTNNVTNYFKDVPSQFYPKGEYNIKESLVTVIANTTAFKYDGEGTVFPNEINLQAVAYNFTPSTNSARKWEYSNGGTYKIIEGATSDNLTITPDSALWNNTDMISLRYTVNDIYTNQLTIFKVRDGYGAYSVEITSSNGNIFQNNRIDTELSTHVYIAGSDITNTIPAEEFSWKRISDDPTSDTQWNNKNLKGKTIRITNKDVKKKATFICTVVIDGAKIMNGQITIVDQLDTTYISATLESNKSLVQLYNTEDGKLNPDWTVYPYLVLTPGVWSGDPDDNLLISQKENIKDFKWTKNGLSIENSPTHVIDENQVLTIKTNELTLNPNIRYGFYGIYVDPLTKAETPFYSSLSFVRVETSGVTIQAIMLYPLGSIFKNDDVDFLKAHCDLWRGSYIDDTDVEYKWFIEKPGVFDPKFTSTAAKTGDNVLHLDNTTGMVRDSNIRILGYDYVVATVNSSTTIVLTETLKQDVPNGTRIYNPYYNDKGGIGWAYIDQVNNFGVTGYTTNEITIPESTVLNFATFKCVITDLDSKSITYNQSVYATASFLDQQDPLQISFNTPEGTIFKNKTGTITIEAEVWRNGEELDEDGSTYIYDWIQYDKNGQVISTFSRINKTILITPDDVDSKSTFEVRLKNSVGQVIAKGRITIVDIIDGSNSIIIYTRDMLEPIQPRGASPAGWNVNPNTFDEWYGLLWQAFNINNLTGEPSGEWTPPLLADEYTTNMFFRFLWNEGTGDYSKYLQYGTNANNKREILSTPFNMPDVVWKCISTADGDTDGGFYVPNIPIYHHLTYRYSIWVKQMQRDGTILFGCDPNTSLYSGQTSDGLFWGGDLPELNKWYLLVGYINSSEDNTGEKSDAGIYDPKTGRKASDTVKFRTFKFKNTDEVQMFRAYQSSALGIGTEVHFWGQRLDLCNNREPSISELLKQTAIGTPARSVEIQGDQLFKYKDDFQGDPIPNVINIIALTQNILDPQYIWRYKTENTNWTVIEDTTNSLTISPNDPKMGWSNGNTYVTYRVDVGDYYDTHTIVKITDGINGINGADGVDGTDGTSIVWKGEFESHPINPENGWAYKNTTDGKSYVFQSGVWYQMTVDGINGKNGEDGLSIEWKGEFRDPPSNPQINWVYRDIDNGKVYIYNGTAWTLMVADGSDGTDGTDGSNGFSVYITYHDSELKPNKPTGDGTTGGWHTDTTDNVIWMSQKVAPSATEGEWGDPIKIVGVDGWYTDFKYALGETVPTIQFPSGKSPGANWYDNPPQPTRNQFVWMTKILKNPITFEVKEGEQWSTPVKMTGDRGEDSYSVIADSEYHDLLVESGTKNEIDSSYFTPEKSGTTLTVLKGTVPLTYNAANTTTPSKGFYSITIDKIDEGLSVEKTGEGVIYPTAFDSSKLILHVTIKVYCEDSGIYFIKTLSYRKTNEENFYVEDALKYTTNIEGGLILSTSIRLGHTTRIDDFSVTFTDEKAGIYGGSDLPGMGFIDKTVRIWSGGTLESAQLWSNEFENYKDDPDHWRSYTPPGSTFVVRQDGSVLAKNGLFLGTVIADNGYFNGTIHSFDGQIGNLKINADGSFGQSDGNFYVDSSGNLTANNANISGILHVTEGGSIGNMSVKENYMEYLSPLIDSSTRAGIQIGQLSNTDSWGISLSSYTKNGNKWVWGFSLGAFLFDFSNHTNKVYMFNGEADALSVSNLATIKNCRIDNSLYFRTDTHTYTYDKEVWAPDPSTAIWIANGGGGQKNISVPTGLSIGTVRWAISNGTSGKFGIQSAGNEKFVSEGRDRNWLVMNNAGDSVMLVKISSYQWACFPTIFTKGSFGDS
jgi:hypothetical protein